MQQDGGGTDWRHWDDHLPWEQRILITVWILGGWVSPVCCADWAPLSTASKEIVINYIIKTFWLFALKWLSKINKGWFVLNTVFEDHQSFAPNRHKPLYGGHTVHPPMMHQKAVAELLFDGVNWFVNTLNLSVYSKQSWPLLGCSSSSCLYPAFGPLMKSFESVLDSISIDCRAIYRVVLVAGLPDGWLWGAGAFKVTVRGTDFHCITVILFVTPLPWGGGWPAKWYVRVGKHHECDAIIQKQTTSTFPGGMSWVMMMQCGDTDI